MGFVEWQKSLVLSYMVNHYTLFFSLDKAVELDYQWIEFDDVRYHVQVSL